MLSRPARPIRTPHLDDFELLVATCLSGFTHFVILAVFSTWCLEHAELTREVYVSLLGTSKMHPLTVKLSTLGTWRVLTLTVELQRKLGRKAPASGSCSWYFTKHGSHRSKSLRQGLTRRPSQFSGVPQMVVANA